VHGRQEEEQREVGHPVQQDFVQEVACGLWHQVEVPKFWSIGGVGIDPHRRRRHNEAVGMLMALLQAGCLVKAIATRKNGSGFKATYLDPTTMNLGTIEKLATFDEI